MPVFPSVPPPAPAAASPPALPAAVRPSAHVGGVAAAFSAWARTRLAGQPGLAAQLAAWAGAPFPRALMQERLQGASEATLDRLLRELRRDVMLTVMQRDLAGTATLAEVTATMSALAEEAIRACVPVIETELAQRYGVPWGPSEGPGGSGAAAQNGHAGARQHLHVVGMGKLGGGELNVSSDIDLIFLYPAEGQTRGGTVEVSCNAYFNQLGKRLIQRLSNVDADGYVFRVDMRLRPWGDGSLAMSFDALEDYFVAHGRDWERYAWIKARVLTGDCADALMRVATPFVFRRYLDFVAVESLKGLHAQIRREVARRDLADHVKLGPGGIREIEFIAQAMQMIRGGREARLRLRPTVPALHTLAELGLLPRDAVAQLCEAYDFLRRVEHRLQYADDQQTHTLPAGAEARLRLAAAMGCADWPGFMALLDAQRANVRRHFECLLGDGSHAVSDEGSRAAAGDGPGAADTNGAGGYAMESLVGQGFDDAVELNRLIGLTREGSKIRRLAAAGRERFDQLLPHAVEAARATSAPDAALKRLIHFLEGIAARASYLALLMQSRAALLRLAKLLAASEWAAQYLSTHPILLDALLDERTLQAAPDFAAWSGFAAAQLQAGHQQNSTDLEVQMNVLREAHQAQVFLLLAQDLRGMLTIEILADHLSELADRALDLALAECWAGLKEKHRASPQLAIIAYGKLGGKELGYASDLDLVFIYDDPHERAAEIYARLAQRLLTFMETRTTAGRLFETDTRLRPDGDSGLLVTSLAAFRDYQEKRAWAWEHQALTRARYCAGAAAIGAAFEEVRKHILMLPREHARLTGEVNAMRQKMHEGHPNPSTLFDLKHDAGGMVDIEFCVQTLVLEHARMHAPLIGNRGNIALLLRAADAGLIERGIAQGAADAYRTYRQHQHALRLNNAGYARLPPSQVAAERQAVLALRSVVLGA